MIEEEIDQINEWMNCAHEMLTTEKYQELPEECLEVLFSEECDDEFEGEDEECEAEEGGCCGGGGCK